MGRRIGLRLLVLFSVATFGLGAQAQETVATPAIDPSIFKDGEVENRDFKFGEWYAKCQQIIRIKRRICNLLSSVADAGGKTAGSVIIATTDAGIPAMMISVPTEVTQRKAISVDASHLGKVDGSVVKVEFSQVVNPMICDNTCKYMFPLDPKLVFILNAGEGIRVSTPPKERVAKKTKKKPPVPVPETKVMTISGQGFSETLAQSTKTW